MGLIFQLLKSFHISINTMKNIQTKFYRCNELNSSLIYNCIEVNRYILFN